ncbi:MAG: NmrA family NAD(P)-binding protein [Xanthobacteraceae bacterium]
MTIAVVGATGNTGRAVVKELKALGQNPISVVRNAEKAREVLGADAKVAVAELTDKPALEKALAGVDSVFVVTGHNPGMVEQQNNVLDAALKAGAKYLVRVSGGAAVAFPDSPSVVGQGHLAIEERLKNSGIGWVILKPGLFMQNTFGQAAGIKNDGKFFGTAAPDAPLALVDVRDTGALGARILLDPAPHAGKTYEFTGKLTTFTQVAEALSQALGKKVTYVPLTLEQNETAVRSRGLPDWLTTHLLVVAKGTAAGGFSEENTKPIEDIAKRPPISIKKFVEDFKGLFV